MLGGGGGGGGERERDVCVTIEMCVVKVQCVCEQVATGEQRFHSIMHSLNDEATSQYPSTGSLLSTLNYNTHNHVQCTIAKYAPPKDTRFST